MQRIPKPWPSAKDLTELLDKAGSSFAFAMTIIQFVGGDSMPHKALQKLLESEADGLDPLYKQVLSSAPRTVALHQILGTISAPSSIFSMRRLFMSYCKYSPS